MFQFFLIWKIVKFLKMTLHKLRPLSISWMLSLVCPCLKRLNSLSFDIPHMWPIKMQCIFVNIGPLISCIQDFLDGNINKKKWPPPTPLCWKYFKFDLNNMCFKIHCEMWNFGLEKNFQKTCFEYFFSKACQYATNYEKVCREFKYVFIKFVKANLLKCIA